MYLRDFAGITLTPKAVRAISAYPSRIVIALVSLLEVSQIQEEPCIFIPSTALRNQPPNFIVVVLRLYPRDFLLVRHLHLIYERRNHTHLSVFSPRNKGIRFGFVFHITQQFINELPRIPGLPWGHNNPLQVGLCPVVVWIVMWNYQLMICECGCKYKRYFWVYNSFYSLQQKLNARN